MAGNFTYSIFPLGDSAVTLDLGNCIDEQYNIKALQLYDWLQAHRFPGIQDIVVAYSSVSVFYDPAVAWTDESDFGETVFSRVKDLLTRAWKEAEAYGSPPAGAPGYILRIPVCYEAGYAPDIDWVAQQTGLSVGEVVRIHCAGTYRVYMIGFLPGFSYMGTVDRRIELPRKKQPVNVLAGGVGIAGMQTGIYPLNSPGGWQIIGRTPVKLFDPGLDPPVRLQTGDQVQFYPIPAAEFDRIRVSDIVRSFK